MSSKFIVNIQKIHFSKRILLANKTKMISENKLLQIHLNFAEKSGIMFAMCYLTSYSSIDFAFVRR